MEALMPIGHQGSMGEKVRHRLNQSQPQKSNCTALMPLWLFSLRELIARKRGTYEGLCV